LSIIVSCRLFYRVTISHSSYHPFERRNSDGKGQTIIVLQIRALYNNLQHFSSRNRAPTLLQLQNGRCSIYSTYQFHCLHVSKSS